eukprot:CFRG4333T1
MRICESSSFHAAEFIVHYQRTFRWLCALVTLFILFYSVIIPPGTNKLPKYVLGVIRRDLFLHFTAYGTLSWLLFASFGSILSLHDKRIYTIIYGLFFLLAHSLTKEVIQYFTPGRTFSFDDILTDMVASVCGMCSVLLLVGLEEKTKRQKKIL